RDQPTTRGAGLRAEGPRASRPGDRVVYLAIADAEKAASRAEPDRHLRPRGRVPEAARRGAGAAGAAPAARTPAASRRGGARRAVSRGPRTDPPQVQPREGKAPAHDLRTGALRRARAAGHADADGRRQARRPGRAAE